MTASIYSAKNYRDYLHTRIKQSDDRWGLISRMAEAAQCQRSQLSRVLSSHIHLTFDQAFGLCDFWELSEDETDFFLKLVELERAGGKRYREKLTRDLERERRRQEDLATRLKRPPAGADHVQSYYYSAWHWTAIHILVSIPRFATVPAIAEKLSLPKPLVEHCLNLLKEWGLVTDTGGKWKYSAETSHLPRQSPMISLHHSNWRTRAVADSQVPDQDGVHFTIVQSVSEKDFARIKDLVLQTIDNYSRIAGPSDCEELVCFTCDFFRA